MDAGDTTPRMGKVEQRREQLPRAPKVGALGNSETIADNCMDAEVEQ